MLELGSGLGSWLYYGARMYDPVIARFTGVDPISDEFPWVNTYNYAENEPVANIDLHGLQKFNTTQYDSNKARMTSEEKKVFLQAQTNALIEVADALVDELPLVGEVRAALEGDATGVLMAALFPGGRKLSKASRLLKNKKKGAEFEKKVESVLKETDKDVEEQITVKTKSGTRTRLDFLSTEKETGKIRLTEAKSSEKARLTKNQRKAFPEIEKDGATIVGSGKGKFKGGTKIAPTKVEIKRPKNKN